MYVLNRCFCHVCKPLDRLHILYVPWHSQLHFGFIFGTKQPVTWNSVKRREACVNDCYFAWTTVFLRERHPSETRFLDIFVRGSHARICNQHRGPWIPMGHLVFREAFPVAVGPWSLQLSWAFAESRRNGRKARRPRIGKESVGKHLGYKINKEIVPWVSILFHVSSDG